MRFLDHFRGRFPDRVVAFTRSSFWGGKTLKLQENYRYDGAGLVLSHAFGRRFVTLNFGRSFKDQQHVIARMLQRVPITVEINVIGLLIAYVVGIPLGVLQAVKQNSATDRILTTGEIPRITDYETIESHFYVRQGETLQQDNFPDDLALICKTDNGLVIVLGCAHRGIINTIQHARKITGEDKIHTVIGGTHLYPKKDNQIEKTIQALKKLGVQHIGVSHCTGLKAAMKLAQAFGDRFFFNNAGSVCKIE